MFSHQFLRATLERGIKTFAQVLAALLTADGTGILNSNWSEAFSVSAMAALLSLLTSIGSSQFGPNNGPSLTGDEHLSHSNGEGL